MPQEGYINHLFSSYIKGGTIWPQIRGGINIYMLSTIANIQVSNKIDWKFFLNAELSQKQLLSAQEVMEKLHVKSGVYLSSKVDLQEEWRSAKAAIFKSFLHYAFGITPEYKSSIKELLTIRNAEIIQNFTDEFSVSKNVFFKICTSSKVEIEKYSDLAALFVYYISKNIQIDRIKYQDICSKYRLPLKNAGDKEIAKVCLKIVNASLYEYLKTNYSNYCFSSVCWGLELPHYLS